ncbi:unnamed protein product, partial [Brugia pahangi]|uniref:Uncharacterized protein n=1 Tax=Brugia pahangi TaxID=6280 RepID=A0A0N4T5U2_BRUPA
MARLREIRPVLSRLRWCDASSDVDEALSDLEKIFVLPEAWRWSKIDDIVTFGTGVVRLAEAQTRDPGMLQLTSQVHTLIAGELMKIHFIILSCWVELRLRMFSSVGMT